MAPRIEPGSRWVLRRGNHSGTVIEVEGQSYAGSVQYKVVQGGDNVGTGGNWDDGRVHHKRQDEFLTMFQRDSKVKNGANGMTQPAFRQDNTKVRIKRLQDLAQIEAEAAERRLQQGLGKVEKSSIKNGMYVHPGLDELSIAIEMISPAMAQAWLDSGGINRKPSERNILRLMHAITIGEWDLTGETIKIDKDGKLRDGQHRLWAIVRSGITVPSIVVRGIRSSAFDKIDTGKSRNMADVLSIHGHASSIALATAARGLMIIESYGRYDVGGTRVGTQATPSNAQGLAYIEAHPEVHEALKLADILRKEGQFIGGAGLWTIALTMTYRASAEQTKVFVGKLIEGAQLEAGSPILKLRNMYRGGRREWSASTESRERLLATVIKGWNAWRRDELVQALSWHNTGRSAEKFPVAD